MSRGADEERKVARMLREQGEVAFTTKNDGCEHADRRHSHGIVDVISFPPIGRPRLIQVKTTSRPYERFGPAERAWLIAEAKKARAEAWLFHRPKGARQVTRIHSSEWPGVRRRR